jgi:hypothetical protein
MKYTAALIAAAVAEVAMAQGGCSPLELIYGTISLFQPI